MFDKHDEEDLKKVLIQCNGDEIKAIEELEKRSGNQEFKNWEFNTAMKVKQ